MKYTTYPRCACKGPDGKLLGSRCPDLWRKDGKTWNHRHGSYEFAVRIPTGTGTRRLRWSGYGSKAKAEAAAGQVRELIALAADEATRGKIGDLIFRAGRDGLPDAADLRRQLGLGLEPGRAGQAAGAWLDTWLAGKRRTRRASTVRSYEMHIRLYIKPVIGDLPLERVNTGHVEAVLADVPGSAGTRRRVLATLRAALNDAVRRRKETGLDWNPAAAVMAEPENTPEPRRWTAGQVRAFLAATAGDPMGLLFRVALLHGPRRGELCGLRWSGVSPDGQVLTIERTLLQLGGKLAEGTPKTEAGKRRVYLGPATAALLRAHRETQELERQFADGTWTGEDPLVFCQPGGQPWNPDYVSKRFRRLAASAGVPPIKLHEARHSAISLMRDAGVDREIRMREAGHADQAVADRYTHILDEAHRAAAGQTESYVLGDGGAS